MKKYLLALTIILFCATIAYADCTGGGTSCTKDGTTYTCTDATLGCIADAVTCNTGSASIDRDNVAMTCNTGYVIYGSEPDTLGTGWGTTAYSGSFTAWGTIK